jgi:hypothetical protein
MDPLVLCSNEEVPTFFLIMIRIWVYSHKISCDPFTKGPSLLSTDLALQTGPLALWPLALSLVCLSKRVYIPEWRHIKLSVLEECNHRSFLHVQTPCSHHVRLMITLDPYLRGLSDQQVHWQFSYNFVYHWRPHQKLIASAERVQLP